MHRRRVLALLTAVVAGCSGQDAATETRTATPTAADTPSATDTQTATDTSTDTPTETGTATPGAPERAGNEAIAEVEKTLNSVVATYGGADSDSLLGADASSTDFRGGRIAGSLTEAETELETARERAVTRDQQRTVERLAVTIRFLELALQIQTGLGNAFFELERARNEIDQEDGGDARDNLSRLESERQLAIPLFESLRAETDAAAVSVISTIDTADYEAKVAQFDAEIAALGGLRSRLERLSRAVGLLAAARAQDRNNSESAGETARRAASDLDDAEASLRTFLDDLPEPADSLAGITEELIAITATKATAAREIAGETATPTETTN